MDYFHFLVIMNNAAINTHVSSIYFYLYSFLFDHPYFSYLCVPSDPVHTISDFFLQGSNISNKVSPPFSSGNLLPSSSNLDGYPQIYSRPFFPGTFLQCTVVSEPLFPESPAILFLSWFPGLTEAV